MLSQTRQGIIFAIIAYVIWGIAPAFFKFIEEVPSQEIVAHRVLWSFFFMILLLTISVKWHLVKPIFQQPEKLFFLSLSATLIGSNWLMFIWAVNHGHMLDTSLGYFITPLMNMLLGLFFLGERFRKKQKIALFLVICSVIFQLWQFRTLPYIALFLALTFSLYGFVRKKIGVNAQVGMLAETLWLLPFAFGYLFFIANSPTSNLSQNSLNLNVLLMMAGVVTTVPLLFFTAAATRLRLSTLGFFQYIGPTLTFILAVVFYGEKFTASAMITFALIWSALGFFIWDAVTYKSK